MKYTKVRVYVKIASSICLLFFVDFDIYLITTSLLFSEEGEAMKMVMGEDTGF